MSKTPGQDTYSTAEVAKLLEYTRQSINNAIKALELDVKKDTKGYHLTPSQVNAIAAYFNKEPLFNVGQPDDLKETVGEPIDPTALFDKSLNRIIESYEKQLAAKDELINRLQDDLRAANEANHQLSAGYATEKAADSMERMNAIVPREQSKISFADRLRILFTGQR